METLKKTCLYDSHIALGAQMSPFGGFMMPIQYSGIIEEHNAVRTACGMFDVSHMGEIFVTGPESESFVNRIFTRGSRRRSSRLQDVRSRHMASGGKCLEYRKGL